MNVRSLAAVAILSSLLSVHCYSSKDPVAQCDFGDVRIVEPSPELFTLSEGDFLGDSLSSIQCDGGTSLELPGPEVLVAFRASAGDRVRLRASPEAGLDSRIFAMRGCDAGQCVRSADRCGTGLPETLNFRIDEDEGSGVHVFGVNVGRRQRLQVRALTPVCGNGRRDPGETCDEGDGSNDGRCDGECRQILSSGSQETEPNDNRLQENVVRLEDGTARLAGQLAGGCDVDRYAVQVPEGASLRAAIFGVGGTACDPQPPPLRMRFEDPRNPGVEVSGERRSDTGQNSPCVTLGDESATQNLAAGEYHVIVRTPRAEGAGRLFVYQLELELQ
jgi:hypothetical protein